ncbi:MAG: hypothetical protein IKP47_01395 [Ruminococcus sp.]|nr:hypothetical protein [Ruminococcus sp.]
MRIRRLAAAAAAAALMLLCPVSAFAEQEPPEDSSEATVTEAPPDSGDSSDTETEPTETKPTETQAPPTETKPTETQAPPTETQTQTQTQTVTETAKPTETTESAAEVVSKPDPSELDPSKVMLEVGRISDGKFDVELRISPQTPISGAKIRIEYDSSVVSLESSTISSAIGGIPSDSSEDGVYKFAYINTEGTIYSGTYSTLHFKVKDDSVNSSVIYVSVESLENTDLAEIPNNIKNGIVRFKDDESYPGDDDSSSAPESRIDEETGLPIINVKLDKLPVTLDSLGVPDVINVKSVKLMDMNIAFYEQGAVFLQKAGETEMIVKYLTGKELRFILHITEPADQNESKASEDVSEAETDNTGRNLCIAAAVAFGIAAIALEYIFIMKPFKKKKRAEAEKQDEEFVAYDDDDAPEMVQDPEEVFARRKKPEETQQVKKPAGKKKP